MDQAKGAENRHTHIHAHAHAHKSTRCQCRPLQRRSHTKSRNGCRNCKQRRVKCDENRPSCRNCSRSSILCDFDSLNIAASIVSPSSSAAGPRKRGRPLKSSGLTRVPSSHGPASQAPALSLSVTDLPSNSAPLLPVDDLHLYHHYITCTSLTFGDDVMWRDKVPLLAFEHHFILHLVLAISALHLARLRVMEANRYQRLAEAHQSVALREATCLLPNINRKNCSALYAATVLICNCTFAKPPAKGHLLVTAERTEVSWWVLFRGVRFVIETMGLPAIFSGCLGPFPPEAAKRIPSPPVPVGYIKWEKPLADLERRICDSEDTGPDNLLTICSALVDCFRGVYGTSTQPEECAHGRTHVVMRWLWFIEDDFIKQVELLMPQALVLLAHFAVLMQTLECFWYMRGWAHHIMDGVLLHLDSEYLEWISWPREQIGQREHRY